MKSKDEILSSVLVDETSLRISAVYFLIDAREIVYVGQTTNLVSRISHHMLYSPKFDGFSYVEVPKRDLLKIERMYIERFNPIRNVQLKRASDFLPKNIVSNLFEDVPSWAKWKCRLCGVSPTFDLMTYKMRKPSGWMWVKELNGKICPGCVDHAMAEEETIDDLIRRAL